MGLTTQLAHESKLYNEFSQVYDLVFARVFYPRIARVVRSLAIPAGAKVLELGVGTGQSLGCYPRHCDVVGIDLAPDMLVHAQQKIDRKGWRHIRLLAMDAMNLEFEDSSFDYVMAFHVVSVVPDAAVLMREAQRVCRPGGTIVIINHFRSRHPVLAALDRRLEPVTRRWGWHTLDRAELLHSCEIEVQRLYKTSPRSLFTVVIGRNAKCVANLEDIEAADVSLDLGAAGVDRQQALAQ